MKSFHIILASILILSGVGFAPIVYAEEYEAGHVFTSEQSFAEGVQFGGGVDFGDTAYTFPAWTFFSGAHEFTGDTVHQFTGNGIIFGDGSGIVFSTGMPTIFGECADFSGGLVKDGLVAGKITIANTYDECTMFAAEQEFTVPQNFEKYNHFSDTTIFSVGQTFKEGTTFGPGSIFTVGQELPAGTIPSQGVIMNAVTCSDTACVPDAEDVIAPGEKFEAGIDPAATFHNVRSNDKTFEIDGLGLTMTFDTVSTNGTIKADLLDPASVSGASLNGDTLTMTLNDGSEKQSIGNVIELATDTASVSGNITITLPYQQSELGDIAEDTLTAFHYVGGQWKKESNCTVDTAANTVTCTVSSLSPFSVGDGSSSSSGASCTQCKVLRTHEGFAINDQTYTLVKKYNDIDTNVVKTGEPVTITLSVPNSDGASRITSMIVYMDVYGSPNNYKHSPSISYSINIRDKVAISDHNGLWSSADVESEDVQHPVHQATWRTNYTFTMIFDKPMEGSHIVTEATNHYGIPEVLYVLDALDVVENEGNYVDEVELQEQPEPEVIIQNAPEPEVVVEPKLVNDPEPVFMSDAITSLELILDPEPIPAVSAEPEQLQADPEPTTGLGNFNFIWNIFSGLFS